MLRRLLPALIAVLAAIAIGLAVFWQPEFQSAPTAPSGGDFILQSADGPVDTASMRGKVLLVYLGYTYCPDICPTSLSVTGQALTRLAPSELALVRTIFISVDPERDTTPAWTTQFFHRHGRRHRQRPIDAAARQFGAVYARQDIGSAAGYAVDHSAWTYVVAPDGRLAGRIPHGASVEQTLAEIRKWLPVTPTPKGTP
jgi:protein SCO1/2